MGPSAALGIVDGRVARDGRPSAWTRVRGDVLLSARFRRDAGTRGSAGWSAGETLDAAPGVSVAEDASDVVVQLERRGGAWLAHVARWGEPLVTRALDGAPLPDAVCVWPHADAATTVSNVRVTRPAPADFRPYHDYLGSRLEILDVATGDATVVHEYAGSFQAPNWTPDGGALIYAQEGRLYRFDLATRTPHVIDTGFATRNNNDHVLSPDGHTLGISHHSDDDDGASIIYTLPADGGTPRRVTRHGPSYLHGFSPDGRRLVYAGQRDGVFDVYAIPVEGGDEVRLTHGSGVDDGPEYTPDGRWIYFNSSRTGRMQLWRMRPDGSAQEQVTHDAYNDWFPHVSPDGRWLAYVAFPPDIPADDHPFYRHVTIRLLPTAGGASTVAAYVYGGQGTMNVSSWSPDGRRLAFVSNTAM